jgi:hypothetical protein
MNQMARKPDPYELRYPDWIREYAARIIASWQHDHIARIAWDHRHLLPELTEFLDDRKTGHAVKVLRVENNQIGAALRQFAGTEHRFTAPDGEEWVADSSAGAQTADTPQGWMQALHCITRDYPLTIILIIDDSPDNAEFLAAYVTNTGDSRVVILDGPPGE